jgi:hypothetical protein
VRWDHSLTWLIKSRR